MPIGVTDFPELRAPTRVNPINESLEAAISSYYHPQEKSADVSLKQAQANQANATANFTAPQIAATLLANPTIRDTLGKDAVDRLTKYASQALDAGVTRGTNQMYGGQNRSPLIDTIHSAFGLDHLNQSPQTGMQQSPVSPPNNETAAQPSVSANGSNANPDSTINRIAGDIQNPGSQGGVNPAAVGEAQEGALKTTATTEAGNVANQWKDRQTQNAADSKAASQAIIDNNNVLNGYKKLNWAERGPYAGGLKAVSNAAIDFDRYANARSTSLAQAVSNGNLTGPQMETGRSLKVSREAKPENVEHAMAFDTALQARTLQRSGFDIRAQQAGLTPAQADVLWSRYINEKPFWDADKERILHKNLDYNSYLEPNKIAWAKKPSSQDYLPKEQQGNDREINLNGFKDEAEFQKWYNSADPETQAAARKQLGADY